MSRQELLASLGLPNKVRYKIVTIVTCVTTLRTSQFSARSGAAQTRGSGNLFCAGGRRGVAGTHAPAGFATGIAGSSIFSGVPGLKAFQTQSWNTWPPGDLWLRPTLEAHVLLGDDATDR